MTTPAASSSLPKKSPQIEHADTRQLCHNPDDPGKTCVALMTITPELYILYGFLAFICLLAGYSDRHPAAAVS